MKNKKPKKTKRIKFAKWLKKVRAALSDLLFPENLKCIFCGVDVPDFEHKPYCEDCEKTLPFSEGQRCSVCDQPIASEATVCDFCQKEKKNFEKAFCPFEYAGVVKKAILGFKESNQRYRAKPFAKLIVQYMQTEKPELKLDVVTYIPMTERKEKLRTFNQSKLLAEEVGKLLNIPVLCVFKKNFDAKKTQKKSTFKERRANLMGMYSLKKVKLKKTDNLLLVDDVLTTCATVGYCAGLARPKVNKVYVCGIAREYVRSKPQTSSTQTLKHFSNGVFPKKK